MCVCVCVCVCVWASQEELVVKNPPANEGDLRDAYFITGLGRLPGGGHGNPLQYICLDNSMDRGAWRAMVHRVAKSWTPLKQLSMHIYTHAHFFRFFSHIGYYKTLSIGPCAT